ncbi:ABC transporter ATP-binding protein [Rhodococcus rhodochrous]|uniref:ABC transporter ATP-binding protein n=1 Tax=Rhodococcus rhodochrous TaxID=1829 RepID=UPI001E630215|nr:ABC transporter ATP-binding protein [Rhodococcus rhodochrous]MCB8913401.1 ABC transporter ATP-binding protein [Rhodococcus rhodochrous]
MVVSTLDSERIDRSGLHTSTPRDPAVAVRGLGKSYGAVDAVRDIDLDIPPGAFVSILGPSGSGKTTVLRSVAGLERPTRGRIDLSGRTVFDAEAGIDESIAARNVGVIFQNYALWPHKTVLQHVLYPLGRGAGKLPRSVREPRARETLAAVGLEALGDRYPYELSGGQQQRVAVARAIAARPPLLLMDEPLSNLDAQLRDRLRRELRAVHDAAGATSLYVTHDQEEAFALSDHVILMHDGQIVQQGPPVEVFRRPESVFAATFFGFENLFSAAEFDTVAEHSPFRPAATVAFRARAVHLRAAPDTPAAGRIGLGRWTVQAEEFTGDEVYLQVTRGLLSLAVAVPVTTVRVLDRLTDLIPGHQVDLDVDLEDLVDLGPDGPEIREQIGQQDQNTVAPKGIGDNPS